MVASAISTMGLSRRDFSSSPLSTKGKFFLILPVGVAGNMRATSATVTCGMTDSSVASSVSPMAVWVRGPAMPSASRPSLFWKAISAALVEGPKSPSRSPGLNPSCCKRFWSLRTCLPESPSFSKAMKRSPFNRQRMLPQFEMHVIDLTAGSDLQRRTGFHQMIIQSDCSALYR